MRIPDIIKEAARKLRKNMTIAEMHLWEHIKRGKINGNEFQKQKPIFVIEENSGFPRFIIADFIHLKQKLIIEIDGNIHNIPEVLELDIEKEKLLKNRGYNIVRFTNKEVLENTELVIQKIKTKLAASFL